MFCPAGKPGSQVHIVNVYRLRLACTPADMQLKLDQSLLRSKLLPNSTAPQEVRLKDVVYQVGTRMWCTAAAEAMQYFASL